jgi:hypothetical protein
VAVDLDKKAWLASLVDAALEGHDPAAALLRLPPELRGADPDGPGLEARARTLLLRSMRRKFLDAAPARGDAAEAAPSSPSPSDDEAFLAPIEGHVGLALDIAVLHGAPFDAGRRRAELAALFAAVVGEVDLARAVDPGSREAGRSHAVQKAFVAAGEELRARGYPPGDLEGGLPLRVGLLCIQRRHLARLAIGYYGKGSLDAELADALLDQARADTALLIEALAGIAGAPGRLDSRRRRLALAQVDRLGLPRDVARRARAGVKDPRPAAELARAAPPRVRPFLLEQLLLSEIASGPPSAARAKALQEFADEAQIPPEQVAALQAEAAELHAGQRWIAPLQKPDDWLSEEWEWEWEEAADKAMEKVAAVFSDNLEAIVAEVKKTGELAELLAKAAAGYPLTGDEKTKVKAQLVDLAKAVPALAIFAAPGGMLLLPLLAKLLPFSILPSSFAGKEKGKAPKRPTRPPTGTAA